MTRWSRTNQLIIEAAKRLGVRCEPLSERHTDFFMRLSAPSGTSVIISKTRSPFLTQVAQTLTNNKHVSRALLRAHALPVVPDILVDDTQDDDDMIAAVQPWLRGGQSIVCKPNWGNRARGVSTGLRSPERLIAARRRARDVDLDEEVVIEPEVDGINLRIAVIGGRYEAAVEITRPRLVGDGRRTVAQLVAALNEDERRGSWQSPSLRALDRIEPDEDFEAALAVRGLTQDSILGEAETFEILSEEVETTDRTEEIHPSWGDVAVRASRLLGCDVSGVDLRGPAAAFREPAPDAWRGAGVLEVNVLPALHVHALPTRGEPRPVFERFVAYCLGLPGAPPACADVEVARQSRA